MRGKIINVTTSRLSDIFDQEGVSFVTKKSKICRQVGFIALQLLVERDGGSSGKLLCLKQT